MGDVDDERRVAVGQRWRVDCMSCRPRLCSARRVDRCRLYVQRSVLGQLSHRLRCFLCAYFAPFSSPRSVVSVAVGFQYEVALLQVVMAVSHDERLAGQRDDAFVVATHAPCDDEMVRRHSDAPDGHRRASGVLDLLDVAVVVQDGLSCCRPVAVAHRPNTEERRRRSVTSVVRSGWRISVCLCVTVCLCECVTCQLSWLAT